MGMTAIQIVLFEPDEWVEGNEGFKVAAEKLIEGTFVSVGFAQREVSLRTGSSHQAIAMLPSLRTRRF